MMLTPIRLAALALLLATPAVAQKIAPTRQFGAAVDTYSGPSDAPARTYTPPPRTSAPDRNFGLPTFGSPEANMPKQRATIAPKPQTQEVAPGVQQALPLPQPQIETPDDADPVADAFTRDAGREPLPSEAARSTPGSAAGETPLFTTTDDAADRGRPNRNATASATRPDPSFSTGPAVTSTGGSTLDTSRAPGDRTPLDSTGAPNPLVTR